MREGHTYRAARRNGWKNYRDLYHGLANSITTWAEFNRPDHEDKHGEGSVAHGYRPGFVARSKYQPHIGKKERGRYAA